MANEGSVRVPELATPGKEVDCEIIERNGISYFRQKVLVVSETQPLPDGATTEQTALDVGAEQLAIMRKIYKQLAIMNMHLAEMTGERITSGD